MSVSLLINRANPPIVERSTYTVQLSQSSLSFFLMSSASGQQMGPGEINVGGFSQLNLSMMAIAIR